MMTDRYSRSRKRSWFVPVVVVVGVAGFFLWESGWKPLEVLPVPTGSLPGDATADGSASVLPEVTPAQIAAQQSEPSVADLPDDEMLLEFDSSVATEQLQASVAASAIRPADLSEPEPGGVRQVAYDSAGSASPMAEFADMTTAGEAPARPGSPTTPTPLHPPAELVARLNKIDLLLDENDYLTAHRDLSTIYWYQPQYRSLIRERIDMTSASIYSAPQPHYLKPYVVQPGETLSHIAQRYKVPWQYLARLNRVQPDRIRAGTELKVIRGPFGAVIDLSEFRLTVHAHGYFVRDYEVGIGADHSTPVGEYTVRDKLENPTYYPPPGSPNSVVDADDPANPLGEYWLGFGNGYGIHGTIEPDSIGKARSRGCIRLRENDIAEVFDLLSEGSTVLIRR